MIPVARSLDEEIDRVLASRTLRRSDQLRKLLAYLQQSSKETDPSLLSEVVIGSRLLGRKDFNPKLDTIVRSEMLRLRRKLDEYYTDEDPGATHRVSFDRTSYRPILIEREHTEPVPPPPVAVQLERRFSFWHGLALGVLVTSLAAFVAYWSTGRIGRPPSPIVSHPLWRSFQSGQVDVLIGTPLFFRNANGFERSFDLNFAEDLPSAQKKLSNWPALPNWDLWTPYENLSAGVAITHSFEDLGVKVVFLPARDESITTLAGRRTIILGAPRYVPLLQDLLADENFNLPPHVPGGGYGGFRNANPKPGESAVYDFRENTLEQRSDESMPDYALISRKVVAGGGEVLSVFGNRAQTAGYLVHALLGKPLLDQLHAKVFASTSTYKSVQVVVRVDYSKGKPTGALYLTHRLR